MNWQAFSSFQALLKSGSLIPVGRGCALDADLYRLEPAGGLPPVAIKTFENRSPWIRATVGRFLTRREHALLRRLDGVPGVCSTAPYRGAWALALEWVEGRPMAGRGADGVRPAFFDELAAVVRAVHAAGVVHLDLAHQGNIMCTAGGHPVLLDFQSGFCVARWPGWLVRRLRLIDTWAVLKWKGRCFPDALTADERRSLERRRRMSRRWPFHHWFFWPGTRRTRS